MTRASLLSLSLSLFLSFSLTAQALPAQDADLPPSFVILFADDLGYGDLGCYGHPTIRTPHLDQMAAQGLRFTQFYSAACVCTPSRAALLTGRYAIRSGMCSDRRRVLFPDSKGGLPADETTIAEALKARGYATKCIGKWHLGVLATHHPLDHGFDEFYGLPYSNDMQVKKRNDPALPLYRDREIIEQPADQTTLTRRYTEVALDFLRRSRERPFLLYLPYTFPHVPLHASSAFLGKSPRGLFGDAVEEIDWSVGEILAELRRLGLAERTLVVFTSDNGPWLTQQLRGGSAGLLREGKGSTWEGGMREPAIAWWPGRIAPGQVATEVASTLDLLPTFLALAGGAPPRGLLLDGKDLAPRLLGTGPLEEKPFCFYRGTRLMAIRLGPWKAHFETQSAYGPDAGVKHDPPLLFQLEEDPSEAHDVAEQHPDVVARLVEAARRQRESVITVTSQLDEGP